LHSGILIEDAKIYTLASHVPPRSLPEKSRVRRRLSALPPFGTTRYNSPSTTTNESPMATNPPTGDGHRNGAVRKRSQVKSPLSGEETKRDRTTGEFMAQKKAGKFKGVRQEK
jgi:hypothetical protein